MNVDIAGTKDSSLEISQTKNKIFKFKKPFVITLIAIILLSGFVAFSFFFEIAIPYDNVGMYVEPVQFITVEKKDWIETKPLTKAISDGDVPKDFNDTITLLKIGTKNMNGVILDDVSKIINRNGKSVKVVYVGGKKLLFTSLFVDNDLQPYKESYSCIRDTGIEKDRHFETFPTEVYYLKRTNLIKLETLPDAKFDSLRKKCDLLWAGETASGIEN